MASSLPGAAVAAIREIVHHLVAQNYGALETSGYSGRLSAMDLQTVVARYRRTLVELPDDIFATDAVEVYPQLGNERSWKVDIDLWTKEEGRSDLTLQVMVEEDPDQVRVQIEDLHVL